MISAESKQKLEELRSTPWGKALKEYLDDRLYEVRDVTKYNTWKEAEGGKIAVKLIRDLFYFMEDRKQEPVKKNQYV